MLMKTSKDITITDSCRCGCGCNACIPQRTDTPSRHVPQETILFSVNGKCGYSLVDALKERYTGLDRRGDKMFVHRRSYISLGLEVRLSMHQYYPITRLIYSGYRTRSGQARLMTARAFHFIDINDY